RECSTARLRGAKAHVPSSRSCASCRLQPTAEHHYPPSALRMWSGEKGHHITVKRSALGDNVFRLLVENVEEFAMCAMNVRGEILHWNVGAVRTFGYEESEVQGKPLSFVFTEEDIAAGLPQQELRVAAEQGRS